MTLLTLARDLQRRKARERESLFVAEGVRAVEALLASPLAVRGALVTDALAGTARGASLRAALDERRLPVEEVGARDFDSAAGTDSPQGVLALAEIPRHALDAIELPKRANVLVLDGVQDPGNVGTILRTAAALKVSVTVALPGTVDLWNAKVVRGAMGATFVHPCLHATWDELDAFLAHHDVELWASDMYGVVADRALVPDRLALAVSNEGAGVSDELRRRAASIVCIPIARGVESLNVAVATGILLYQFRQ